jgi:hypothetical protein
MEQVCRAWHKFAIGSPGWDDCFWLHKYSDEEVSTLTDKTGGHECWLSMERFDHPEARPCSCPIWTIREASDRLKTLRNVLEERAHVDAEKLAAAKEATNVSE